MQAVILDRGRQYLVQPGDRLRVDRLSAQPGEEVVFEQVLLAWDGEDVRIGTPALGGVRVRAVVLGEEKAKKLIVFKKKRRKGYRRKQGHRQRYTALRIEAVAQD